MAKGNGMFSNFSGKVGTIVGYTNKQSNNKQTQVVRSYQPVVRNPMTLAQATQRVKFAPVFWTYRKLKAIIDRGQEGVDYGNRSRYAWLKQALSEYTAPWYKKDALVQLPCLCPITTGSLGTIVPNSVGTNNIHTPFNCLQDGAYNTIGNVTESLLAVPQSLKVGDQLTFAYGDEGETYIYSFILDPTDNTPVDMFSWYQGRLMYTHGKNLKGTSTFGLIVQSRKAANGSHLRSTSLVELTANARAQSPYQEASRLPAIESYMSSTTNSDWPEEQL
jgi:hypothetical protein